MTAPATQLIGEAKTPPKLPVDRPAGLTTSEAQKRLATYGPNALQEKQKNALLAFLAYFWAPIPWMIALAWFFIEDRVKLLAYRILDPQRPSLLRRATLAQHFQRGLQWSQ
jgi:magnesium-transporting ATPase (P-type)